MELESALEVDYEDDAEVEVYDERKRDDGAWMLARERIVTVHRPIPRDRWPSTELRARLLELAVTAAEIEFRARASEAPPDRVVVRVLAGTPDSRAYGAGVGEALLAFLEAWGPVERLRAGDDGWGPHPAGEDGFAATALAVEAPGLRELLRAVEGYALQVVARGPDTIAHLARVDVMPPSALAPAEQLDRADAALSAWRAARNRGEDPGPDPLPPGRITIVGAPREQVRRRCLSSLAEGS